MSRVGRGEGCVGVGCVGVLQGVCVCARVNNRVLRWDVFLVIGCM